MRPTFGPSPELRIEACSDGAVAYLSLPLTKDVLRRLDSTPSPVTELHALWRSDLGDLGLLERLTGLQRLYVQNYTSRQLDSIASFSNLRTLRVESDSGFTVDLASWPQLEELAVTWGKGLKNLACATNLAELHVWGWKPRDLALLGCVPRLRELELVGGPLQTLSGIEACTHLAALSLAYMTKLTDFSAVRHLPMLELLDINTCRKLNDVSAFGALPNLETLRINNVGAIASLEPLLRARRIKRVSFIESTNILDGNTEIVNTMNLEEYAFQNRAHYNFNYNHLLAKEERDSERRNGVG